MLPNKRDFIGFAIVLSIAFFFGCSKKKDQSIESAEIIDADTAVVDISQSGAEVLPTIDADVPAAVESAMSEANSLPATEPQMFAENTVAPATTHDTAMPQVTSEAQGIETVETLESPKVESDFAGTETGESYTVQKGDTLMKISFKLYGNVMKWRKLYAVNQENLKNPNFLVTGSKIKTFRADANSERMADGQSRIIRKGETLGTIAEEIFGRKEKWKKLWESNKDLIKNPHKIYAGFYLYYQLTEEDNAESQSRKSTPAPASTSAPKVETSSISDVSGSGALEKLVVKKSSLRRWPAMKKK